MHRVCSILTCSLLLLAVAGFTQNSQDSLLASNNQRVPLPSISINVGFNHGFTDVPLNKREVSPFRQLGYQLTITQQVTRFLNASFELYSGTIYGDEMRDTTNVNFRTSLVSPRLNLEYNFYPLLKPDLSGRQLIRPYIGFGIGFVSYRSKGDLKDASNRTYHYWSDGSIHAEPEGTIDPAESILLERDHVYETELRDANLDGLGRYAQIAFTMPINAGIRFQVSKHVGLNASVAYVLNFTDLIDNVNENSVGLRKGKSGSDHHLFASVGLSVFLGHSRPNATPALPPVPSLAVSDMEPASQEDKSTAQDQQKSPGTIAEDRTAVSTVATTITDTTVSRSTSKAAALDPQEVAVDTLRVAPFPHVDPNATQIQQDTRGSLSKSIQDISNTEPKAMGRFHWADLNADGWISPGEVLHFIDLLFEGEAVRSVSDIQDLIDYYFDQE